MRRRELGGSGIGVSAIGLGCWGMSGSYGPADEEESDPPQAESSAPAESAQAKADVTRARGANIGKRMLLGCAQPESSARRGRWRSERQ